MEKSNEQSLTLGHVRSPSPPPTPHQVLKEEEYLSIPMLSLLDDDHAEINQEPKEDEDDEDEIVDEEEAAAQSGGDPVVLTDDLRDKIVRQVEFYFSDENLPTDKFMLKHVRKDKQGFVPIVVLASFRRMERLVRDLSLIEAALRTSSQLVVSKDGRKVRRIHPLPVTKIRDSKLCTVIVENLPDDYSSENLHKIFADRGKILNITIHDPRSTEESKDARKSERTYSNKLHALIEYETTEAASSAVAILNDRENWRSGMRGELLHKWLGKYGQKPKSDDQHTDKAKKEEEEHLGGGKGRQRNRYKNRGKGQQNTSGQGHGQVPSNGASKPPPGPRMPDGTRGFVMGRGKPSTFEPSQVGA